MGRWRFSGRAFVAFTLLYFTVDMLARWLR